MDFAIPRFTTVDPLAEKYYYSISPYAYCNNNPIKFVDPTGMFYGEYDLIDGKWEKVSNIGDNVEIDFYHTRVKNNKGQELTVIKDKEGNTNTMTGGREILKNGAIRGNDVNWETITSEWMNGTGPAKSIFEGDHPANEAIQGHYLYKNASSAFEESGQNKKYIPVEWGVSDVTKTGTSNGQAQMMGSYGASFYTLGDKTLSVIYDSKSKTSAGLHLPFKNKDRKSEPVYNPWAGTWQKPNNSYKNTYQVYIFFSK
jgi:hypothetical protein